MSYKDHDVLWKIRADIRDLLADRGSQLSEEEASELYKAERLITKLLRPK